MQWMAVRTEEGKDDAFEHVNEWSAGMYIIRKYKCVFSFLLHCIHSGGQASEELQVNSVSSMSWVL